MKGAGLAVVAKGNHCQPCPTFPPPMGVGVGNKIKIVMALIIIGLILLLAPFLLLFEYPNKILGFAKILFSIIVLQLTIALITQALKIFTYPAVMAINAIIFLAIIIELKFSPFHLWSGAEEQEQSLPTSAQKKSKSQSPVTLFKNFLKRIDWVMIFVIITAFLYLYQVHYNYSGKYSLISSLKHQEVKNMVYPYPYFSDEWYSVAFIKDSIKFHSLPLTDPFNYHHNRSFPNFEFAFHSFLSEIMLLLNLNPLTNYTILTIFTSLLICLLIYLFLRFNKVEKLPASVIGLSALYITNGSSLPGLWTLIPIILGTICFLLSLFFITNDDRKLALVTVPITLLFYPPLFPFTALAFITFFIKSSLLPTREKIKNISYYFILPVFVVMLLSFSYFLANGQLTDYLPKIFSKIFYLSITIGGAAQYLIWNIISPIILILSALGIVTIFKDKFWLVAILILGIIYWIIYYLVPYRFIIEYQRVIVFSSIIITIIAGFGLDYLIKKLNKKFIFLRKSKILNYALIVILIFYLLAIPSYTARENWKKLVLYDKNTKDILLPPPLANQYLQPDDLKIIPDWKTNFLSLPWKGTVIGIAKNNISPVSIKGGTISLGGNLFNYFIKSDCQQKKDIAKKNYVNLFYTPSFACPDFQLLATSSEGFYLYFYDYINN